MLYGGGVGGNFLRHPGQTVAMANARSAIAVLCNVMAAILVATSRLVNLTPACTACSRVARRAKLSCVPNRRFGSYQPRPTAWVHSRRYYKRLALIPTPVHRPRCPGLHPGDIL